MFKKRAALAASIFSTLLTLVSTQTLADTGSCGMNLKLETKRFEVEHHFPRLEEMYLKINSKLADQPSASKLKSIISEMHFLRPTGDPDTYLDVNSGLTILAVYNSSVGLDIVAADHSAPRSDLGDLMYVGITSGNGNALVSPVFNSPLEEKKYVINSVPESILYRAGGECRAMLIGKAFPYREEISLNACNQSKLNKWAERMVGHEVLDCNTIDQSESFENGNAIAGNHLDKPGGDERGTYIPPTYNPLNHAGPGL